MCREQSQDGRGGPLSREVSPTSPLRTWSGPPFRIKPTNLEEMVPWVNKNVNQNKTEITSFCLLEICASDQHSCRCGRASGNWSRLPHLSGQAILSLLGFWLAGFLGKVLWLQAFVSSPGSVLAPPPSLWSFSLSTQRLFPATPLLGNRTLCRGAQQRPPNPVGTRSLPLEGF